MTLIGIISKTLFFSEEDGAIIFLLRTVPIGNTPPPADIVRVKGKLAVNQNALPVIVTGEMGDSEYGPTLFATDISECSIGIKAAKNYLSAIGKGVKESTLTAISKLSKGKIFQCACAPGKPEEIAEEVVGDEETVLRLLSTVREHRDRIRLFKYISQHSGNLSESNKLYDLFPENTMAKLLQNPYEMAQQARIPIRIGDSIALEKGIDPMCKQRIGTIVEHALARRESSGDTCVSLESLYKTVKKLSEKAPISSPDMGSAISYMADMIHDTDYDGWYKTYLRKDEQGVADSVARLQREAVEIPWHPEFIDKIEQENGIPFGKQQRMAFSLLKSTGLKILTGGPGTGKTTTTNGLLKYLEMIAGIEKGLEGLKTMVLSAPSGRASQRMAEATGRPASTCHRMIEYAPYGTMETCRDQESPLDAGVVVVDETSMLDVSLARRVLGACKNGSLVLFVGDINQLQSVGPGSVLQDLIRSQRVDVVQLTEVFRQKGGSPIPTNAQKIIEGNLNLEPANDFQMIQTEKGQATNVATELAKQLLHHLGDSEAIQLLAPARRGEGGIYELNTALQPILNGDEGGESLKFGRKTFHEKDRTIMLSNNYSVGYFNGDVGHIVTLNKQFMEIKLATDTIRVERKDFDDVELAYACTIHKSQGSEYPHCIIVLPAEKKFMMDQSVLYTAVTRAKKGVYIVYEEDSLECAIRKRRQGTRNGRLQRRIEDACDKYGIKRRPSLT